MFRSVYGRINLVRHLQQHDQTTALLVQFQPDSSSTHTTTNTANPRFNSTSCSTGNTRSSSVDHLNLSFNTAANPGVGTLPFFHRPLYAALIFRPNQRHHQPLHPLRPSDSYIEEMTGLEETSTTKQTTAPTTGPLRQRQINQIPQCRREPSFDRCASEGYYRSNGWSRDFVTQENLDEESGKNRGRKSTSDERSTFNNLDFNSLNVKLLEVGLIGTAVAVGIDVRSRIHEWAPQTNTATISNNRTPAYASIRSASELCQGHTHNHNPFTLQIASVDGQSSHHHHCGASSGIRGGGDRNDSSENILKQEASGQDMNAMTIAPYCSMCVVCNNVYGNLMFSYFLNDVSRDIPFLPKFILSGIVPKLNVFDQKKEKLSLTFDSKSQEQKQSPQEEVEKENRRQLVAEREDPTKSSSVIRHRKKNIFFTDEQYAKIEEKIKNGHLRKPPQHSNKVSVAPTTPSPPKKVPESDLGLDALSAQYTEQLNNIMGVDLMLSHRPEEAMKCWLNSEANSKAFFNMGVAFESGRHALNAQPDLNRAHDCYAIASSMGHREAIYNLALFYLYGKGKVDVDPDYAMSLLETAARKGVASARSYVEQIHRNQMMDEVRAKLERKISTVPTQIPNKNRARPRLYQRSSASMIGPLHPSRVKKIAALGTADTPVISSTGTLKRNHSAPNLVALVDSKVIRRK